MFRHVLYVNFATLELAVAAEKRVREIPLVITLIGTIRVGEHHNEATNSMMGRLEIPLIQNLGGRAAIGCNASDLSELLQQVGRLQGQIHSLEKFDI